jgi:hypothetical protein
MPSCQIVDKLQKEIIVVIVSELMDHFGGGLSGDRVIRESEAHFLSEKIWERISRSIAESVYETLEAR